MHTLWRKENCHHTMSMYFPPQLRQSRMVPSAESHVPSIHNPNTHQNNFKIGEENENIWKTEFNRIKNSHTSTTCVDTMVNAVHNIFQNTRQAEKHMENAEQTYTNENQIQKYIKQSILQQELQSRKCIVENLSNTLCVDLAAIASNGKDQISPITMRKLSSAKEMLFQLRTYTISTAILALERTDPSELSSTVSMIRQFFLCDTLASLFRFASSTFSDIIGSKALPSARVQCDACGFEKDIMVQITECQHNLCSSCIHKCLLSYVKYCPVFRCLKCSASVKMHNSSLVVPRSVFDSTGNAMSYGQAHSSSSVMPSSTSHALFKNKLMSFASLPSADPYGVTLFAAGTFSNPQLVQYATAQPFYYSPANPCFVYPSSSASLPIGLHTQPTTLPFPIMTYEESLSTKRQQRQSMIQEDQLYPTHTVAAPTMQNESLVLCPTPEIANIKKHLSANAPRYALNVHEDPNEGFICPFEGCNDKFRNKFSLTRHFKRHTGYRPHVCPHEGCDKRFAETSTLKRHIRIHSGERPFQCQFANCGKRFADRTNVKRHEMLHRNERTFWCDMCPSDERHGYFWRKHLDKHKRVHHGVMPNSNLDE